MPLFRRSVSHRPALSVDLGTAFIRIGTPDEPVAIECSTQPTAAGPAAMGGGVIHDLDATARLLSGALHEVAPSGLRRLRMVVSVPATATSVERRAVQWVADKVGVRTPVELIDEPIAAAIGLGLDIADPRPRFVVDIGHGITEAAVIASGDIVVVHAARVGCTQLDSPAADRAMARIMATVQNALEAVEPSIAACIQEMYVVGGGALRTDVCRELHHATWLPLLVDDHPLHAVARGDAVCAATAA